METERLILRHWEDADASSLYLYAKDPRVGIPAGWPPHESEEYSRAYIRTVYNNKETYAIVIKGQPGPVGNITLSLGADKIRGRAFDEGEIGFWIGVPYWGKGLMAEAVSALLKHCFEDLKLKRVWCTYFDGNYRSRMLQKKLGFKYHHTNYNSVVIMLNQVRIEHFNYIDKK